ncbi:MAG TPA: LysR substrate-binding domain-containing protein, partial [Roseiarcus sp.]
CWSSCPTEQGGGIAQLADYVVMDQIASGALEIILPDWTLPSGIGHAVFPSRRGLSPAIRSFIDFRNSGPDAYRHSDGVIEGMITVGRRGVIQTITLRSQLQQRL